MPSHTRFAFCASRLPACLALLDLVGHFTDRRLQRFLSLHFRSICGQFFQYLSTLAPESGSIPLVAAPGEFAHCPFNQPSLVVAERSEKAAVIMTTNLPFSEWTQVTPNARLCKALLDRITDRVHILETGTESYRSRRTAEKRNRPAKTAESKSS